jgi:hypothetical protein
MIFPVESLVLEHREVGLVIAVLIGFGFGFVLERAGFGRAPKLAAQFYFRDMTVFKVMFTAIVTAMLGVLLLSGLGLTDLRVIASTAVSWTYIWPMLVGGFLLGVGFIISGYCPGTSLVAAASGHVDGAMTVAGVVVGSVLYGEFFPLIKSFHESGNLGTLLLPDLLGLPPQVVGLLVTAMAIGCFIGAEKVERIFAARDGRAGGVSAAPGRVRRLAFAGLATFSILALLTLAFSASTPAEASRAAEPITAAELAQRVLSEPWKLRVLDLRSSESYAAARIPGSESVSREELADLGLAYAPGVRDLVLVAEGDLGEVPAAALAYPGRVLVLQGGFRAWKEYALSPPPPPPADATAQALEEWRLRAGIHAALTGVKQAPPPARPARKFVPRKKKKSGGCS